MSTLKKSQRVFSGIHMVGNFVERPLRPGDIVFYDDGQHLIWGNIEDVVDGFSLKEKTTVSSKTDLKFTSESNVDVKFGADANSPVAKGEVQLKFNGKNSAFVSLKTITRTAVKLGLVETQLRDYWKQKGFDKPKNIRKYLFITDVISAQSGTVIFSEAKGNTVVLKGKNNVPLTSLAVIGSGQVEYVSNTKSTLEIISESPIDPLFTAVRYRANGNFEIVG